MSGNNTPTPTTTDTNTNTNTTTTADGTLTKQRPLSSSFNELTRGNSISRKDHELHYLKSYTALTEYELIILRKTAFTNLRNQFRALNDPKSNNLNNNTNVSSSNLPTDKNTETPASPTALGSHLLVNQNSATGSFTALNHHSHNSTPGKDLRESVIKNLENINRGRSSKKWKIFSKKDKKRAVFGVPLVSSLEYAFVYIDPSEKCNNKKIPIVVYECINFLRKNGLKKEGIFRVNGSERRINNCLKIFNETAGYGFGYDFDGMNVFDVASLLKLYLRQLPEPLIPFCLYSSFLDVIKFIPETYEKIKAFQYLFMMLPSAHLILLEILLQFLSEIIQHFDDNHMNAHNLACIFAPNLLRSKESASTGNLLALSSSDEYEVALQVVEFLINHKNKFCITSPDVKPFQLFNKFDREVIPSNTMEGMNSISVSDFTAFQKGNIMAKVAATNGSNNKNNNTSQGNDLTTTSNNNNNNNNNNNDDKDKKSPGTQLRNEIKVDSSETDLTSSSTNHSENNSTGALNPLQPNTNPISFSTSNMVKCSDLDSEDRRAISKSLNKIPTTAEEEEEEAVAAKDADINCKSYHPTSSPVPDGSDSEALDSSSPTSVNSPVTLTLKCKSNLESVRHHSEESFYAINTCPLVSTSLNRLNYLPIKNDEFYEYLSCDNDNITSAPAPTNEKVTSVANTPCSPTNKFLNHGDSLIPKEPISVASFNKSNDPLEGSLPTTDTSMAKKSDLEDGNKSDDQMYPANVVTLAQKNKECSISFLSPLSTPTQPIFSIPPPPTTPPVI